MAREMDSVIKFEQLFRSIKSNGPLPMSETPETPNQAQERREREAEIKLVTKRITEDPEFRQTCIDTASKVIGATYIVQGIPQEEALRRMEEMREERNPFRIATNYVNAQGLIRAQNHATTTLVKP